MLYRVTESSIPEFKVDDVVEELGFTIHTTGDSPNYSLALRNVTHEGANVICADGICLRRILGHNTLLNRTSTIRVESSKEFYAVASGICRHFSMFAMPDCPDDISPETPVYFQNSGSLYCASIAVTRSPDFYVISAKDFAPTYIKYVKVTKEDLCLDGRSVVGRTCTYEWLSGALYVKYGSNPYETYRCNMENVGIKIDPRDLLDFDDFLRGAGNIAVESSRDDRAFRSLLSDVGIRWVSGKGPKDLTYYAGRGVSYSTNVDNGLQYNSYTIGYSINNVIYHGMPLRDYFKDNGVRPFETFEEFKAAVPEWAISDGTYYRRDDQYIGHALRDRLDGVTRSQVEALIHYVTTGDWRDVQSNPAYYD